MCVYWVDALAEALYYGIHSQTIPASNSLLSVRDFGEVIFFPTGIFLQDTLLQQAAFASETDLSFRTSTVVVASLAIPNQSATILWHIVEAAWRLNVFLTFRISPCPKNVRGPKAPTQTSLTFRLWLSERNEWMEVSVEELSI